MSLTKKSVTRIEEQIPQAIRDEYDTEVQARMKEYEQLKKKVPELYIPTKMGCDKQPHEANRRFA